MKNYWILEHYHHIVIRIRIIWKLKSRIQKTVADKDKNEESKK